MGHELQNDLFLQYYRKQDLASTILPGISLDFIERRETKKI